MLHGKAILIKATVDLEDVAFELLTKGIGLNLLSHTAFKEDSASIVIINIDGAGGALVGVRYAELA